MTEITVLEKKIYPFVLDSFSTLSNAVEWAKTIAEGGSLSDGFYYKKEKAGVVPSNWPADLNNPNVGMILTVVMAGYELNLAPMRSLALILPFNGKFTIRGDGAKALIFASGQIKEWKEYSEGKVEDGSFKYHITSERANGIQLSKAFGVEDAKRADLWVTQQKLDGAYGARYKQSPWHRYPTRMCMYRALGFIARDLYPDIMGNLILYEEASDYPDMEKIYAETLGGTVVLDNKDGKIQQVEEMTGKAVDVIEKKKEKFNLTENEKIVKETVTKLRDEVAEIQGKVPIVIKQVEQPKVEPVKHPQANGKPAYTEKELTDMGTKIYAIADILGIVKEIESLPGKKVNKKYRMAILAYQQGKFEQYKTEERWRPFDEKHPNSVRPHEDVVPEENTSHPTPDENEVNPEQEAEVITAMINKHGVTVTPIPEDKKIRDFQEARTLAFDMSEIGLDAKKWIMLAGDIMYSKERGLTYLDVYKSKEEFVKTASDVDIHYFINQF